MPSKPETPSQAPDENSEQLCVSCLTPNDPAAHFCVKCRAPLTAYAAIGPFESVFAEGYAYRQAAERPRSLIVVLGVWMIFGLLGLGGVAMVADRDAPFASVVLGAGLIVVAAVMIGRTTRNYFAGKKSEERVDG